MADYHEGKFYHLSGTLKEHFLEELFLMHIGKYEKQILFSELVYQSLNSALVNFLFMSNRRTAFNLNVR